MHPAVTSLAFIPKNISPLFLWSAQLHFNLQINGKRKYLPIIKNRGVFRVFKSGRYVQIWTRCGIKVNFDGRHAVSVVVPGRYKNRMEGICGNCNGDITDDFTMKNGTDVRNRNDRYSRVGDSFAVPDDSGRTDPKYSCFHIYHCNDVEILFSVFINRHLM